MRDKRPARRDPGDECQRLLDIEMRGMRSKTQGVDHQQLHPDQFPDLRGGDRLEIGQTYTLKRHPIFRSKFIYCAQLTEHRWGNCITDDEGKRVLEEEKLKKEEEKENSSKTDE